MSTLHNIADPRIKRMSDYFSWADYIEILCLISKDGEESFNCLDSFFDKSKKGLYIDEQLVDDFEEDKNIDEDAFIDNLSRRHADLSRTIRARTGLFGGSYPFEFDIPSLTLIRKKQLTRQHLLYIFLLFAGNIRFFKDKSEQNLFTNDFERVGTDALMKLFPTPWEGRHLGTACHPSVLAYTGKKSEKLQALANDINAQLLVDEQDFAKNDTKDAGFDFVCWHPFPNDTASHLPLIFAQSGCTAIRDELYDKQRSISIDRIKNFYNRIACYGVMVTPECFRGADGLWPQAHELTSVFIDRPRIMHLLNGQEDIISSFESMKLLSQTVDLAV